MSVEIKQQLRSFGETTSVRGIPRALKSKDKFIFVLWTLTVVVCATLLLYNLINVILQYYRYNYTTVYREAMQGITQKPLFPDVTVCNAYPSLEGNSDGSLMTWTEYSQAMQTKKQRWPLDLLQATAAGQQLDEMLTSFTYSTLWDILMSRTGYFSSLPVERADASSSSQVSDIGFGQDLIVDCNTYGWDWQVNDSSDCLSIIEAKWDASYYQCYTIALPEQYQQQVRAMTLILYLDDFNVSLSDVVDFGPTFSTSAGARIVLHESRTAADTKLGFSVGPGSEATVKVKVTNRQRLPSPYANCTNKQLLDDGDEKYSFEACIEICLQQQVIQQCGCISNLMKFSKAQLEDVGYTICGNQTSPLDGSFETEPGNDLNGFSKLFCSFAAYMNWSQCQSECSWPCNENQYDLVVTTTDNWPHPAYQLTFYENYIRERELIYGTNFDEYAAISDLKKSGTITSKEAVKRVRQLDLISRNFIQVNIVMDRLVSYEMNDKPAMDSSQLLSNVGGVLSLWLGVTIMTIVEFFELLYFIVGNWLTNRRQNLGKITTVAPNPN